jgi:nucleoside-diphosphate-sugar epimerase
MIKVAITGHTAGIGLHIVNELSDLDVIGFSRANGYTISTDIGRKQIIKDSKDADVFINNAFSDENPWAQTELLVELWKEWKDCDKKIVVISSSTAHRWEPLQQFVGTRSIYYTLSKKLLEITVEQLWFESNLPLITIVAPTLMNVERTKHLDFAHQMNPKTFAESIRKIILEKDHQTRKLVYNWLPK